MIRLALLLLSTFCVMAPAALGNYAWVWNQEPVDISDYPNALILTSNSGAHAVAMGEYSPSQNVYKTWMTIAAELSAPDPRDNELVAYDYTDFDLSDESEVDPFPYGVYTSGEPGECCVAASNYQKLWVWVDQAGGDISCHAKTEEITGTHPGDQYKLNNNQVRDGGDPLAAAVRRDLWSNMFAVYRDDSLSDPNTQYGLKYSYSTDVGEHWYPQETHNKGYSLVVPRRDYWDLSHPSVAVNDAGEDVYVAYTDLELDIVFLRSDDNGANWNRTILDDDVSAYDPCVAANGPFVFVCWTRTNDEGRTEVVYRYSPDYGESWIPDGDDPGRIPYPDDDASYTIPNVVAMTCNGIDDGVLIACRRECRGTSVVASIFGLHLRSPDRIPWIGLTYNSGGAQTGSISVAAYKAPNQGNPNPRGICVNNYVPDGLDPKLAIRCRLGGWRYTTDLIGAPQCGTGRRIALDPTGTAQYAAVNWPHVVSGPIEDAPQPYLVGPGNLPALALDGDGNRWVSYVNTDTVWTMTGDGNYRVVFAGSSSAVPGQPSIVCYSEQATSGYCASVVFAVYDTAGGASKILYARVDTSAVVLDTIESVANLRDSLPCLSLYKTDTLLCTFQHGDSVLAVMLADYGPGTTGRPGAWSSPNLVTASGYHAMSTFELGGSVLNCVWSGKSGNNYAIHRATIDLSGGMFPSWTAQSDPSGTATSEKGNSVYAGLGVTCWQEKVSGKWVIKGKVRGEEETFVANDTDAYHPHAVAESSAISPSIDQVRVHLLWTEGVTFEVDSGVYDTGETRYKCESLSVSRAGSDATKSNTGAKLLRKASGDSLFCVYSDLDGTVMYARSAAGDSWHRDVMVTSRDWPAIAEDSSGKRWVVVHKVNVGGTQTQEAYYRNGSSWTGPQTLYTGQPNGTVGPAGLSGSSYTTSGIAYAAFLLTPSIGPKSIVLAKFNGSTVATYTVASGMSLGDPTLAVEPYKQDSDHVHLSWVDNGVVKYCMDTDGRSSSIASKWTSTVTLSNGQVTATHPCIAADRDQIVAAWAQGATTEIYSRKRSTGSAYNNWQSEVNLSNTSNASDYPTIAMGDTVIVAWEEHRTVSDFDVLASINFGDTINIADNATKSGYPHVLFQNKTSGDTAIPYLHVIWSETPEANVYEVAYNRHNLKQSGEGQQSAGQTPLPRKPMLAACRPNPFRDKTTIAYQLPQAGNVRLCVYDVTGRTVRTLANGFQKPGEYSVNWDSKDSRGRQVPRGVYFYRLDTPGFRDVKKAVVAR